MSQTITETDLQAELDKRYTALQSGVDKGLSLAEFNRLLTRECKKAQF